MDIYSRVLNDQNSTGPWLIKDKKNQASGIYVHYVGVTRFEERHSILILLQLEY